MGNSAAALQIYRLSRGPQQIEALKEVCSAWHLGPENFWPFDVVLDAIARPGSLVYFMAAEESSEHWAAAALIDVGPFSADLLYVYVMPEHRRKKLSSKLMAFIFASLASNPQLEDLFLEVRIANKSAQALYDKLGMEKIGVRKKYYANGDDALVYRQRLKDQTDLV